MEAIVVEGEGRAARLRLGTAPEPSPGPGEVLIAVAATAVNRADILQKRGLYPPPPGASTILGLEAAGRIERCGRGVRGFAPGDRVMALLPGGGYAGKAVAPAGSVIAAPDSLSDAEAAAFPEAFLTAHLNLFDLGGLRRGESALVHGGSGGVGTAAITLLRRSGIRAIVTTGSPERAARCAALGADLAIDYRQGRFAERVLEATDGEGVDLVLDCIGAPYLGQHLECLKPGGRWILIGLMGGRKGEIDLAPILLKRLRLVGSTLRGLSPRRKGALVRSFLARFGEGVRDGSIRPVVDRVLPLGEAEAGHAALEAGGIFGKIVLEVASL